MKDLPVVARVVINIILYIVYVLLLSVVFSLLFPVVMTLFGGQVIHPMNPIYVKIQIFLAILVLLVSLIFRKYFYMSVRDEQEEITVKVEESYTASKKKQEVKNKAPKKAAAKKKKQEDEDDDGIKIYVDKEIK